MKDSSSTAPVGAFRGDAPTQPEQRRLAIFLPALAGGGAERVMLNLSGWFAAQGVPVDMVLSRAEGPLLEQVPSAVRVVNLGARRTVASLAPLVRYLRRERPGALLSALSHANCIAVWATRLAGQRIRVVVSEHDNLSMTLLHTHHVRQRLLPALMRWSYPAAAGVVAVSRGVAMDLAGHLNMNPDSIRVIYNPVVAPAAMARTVGLCPHAWLEAAAPPVVLAVGRLAFQKDHATLIRAFAVLRGARAARLMILGEGELRSDLMALVRELGLEREVALPGFVPNPLDYMKRAAMVALTSRWEGFGNVLVEAMAIGTPVVSTNCPDGPAEILEQGRWGRLVPVGDVQALAAAMQSALDGPNPDARQRAAQFSVEAAALQYQRLLFPERA